MISSKYFQFSYQPILCVSHWPHIPVLSTSSHMGLPNGSGKLMKMWATEVLGKRSLVLVVKIHWAAAMDKSPISKNWTMVIWWVLRCWLFFYEPDFFCPPELYTSLFWMCDSGEALHGSGWSRFFHFCKLKKVANLVWYRNNVQRLSTNMPTSEVQKNNSIFHFIMIVVVW